MNERRENVHKHNEWVKKGAMKWIKKWFNIHIQHMVY